MSDSKSNKVTTTIRFDAKLHQELNDFVHDSGKGKPPKERPSKDAIVQEAVKKWLSKPDLEVPLLQDQPIAIKELTPSLHPPKIGGNLHPSGAELTSQEREFLSECLRIYRSDFSRPLQENVTFFGIGLSAVEALAVMRVQDEHAAADASALSPGEQRAFKIADDAENEADLLKKATRDVAEELRRARGGDQGTSGGTKPRRKSGSGKT